MSSNDYILIQEIDDVYLVSHRDADTNSQFGKEKITATLRDAVVEANKMQEEWPVEYGISVELKKD